jgi:hypothetical protein
MCGIITVNDNLSGMKEEYDPDSWQPCNILE